MNVSHYRATMSPRLYFRTTHVPGMAHNSTPTETSRTSRQQIVRKRLVNVQFLRSIEHRDSRTCSDGYFRL
jgi:hypothetical protein